MCHRLAIEIDGSQHAEASHARSDAIRDARLALRGYRVLRFWNTEIDSNLDGVIETILSAIGDDPTRRLRRHPPHAGEGSGRG